MPERAIFPLYYWSDSVERSGDWRPMVMCQRYVRNAYLVNWAPASGGEREGTAPAPALGKVDLRILR